MRKKQIVPTTFVIKSHQWALQYIEHLAASAERRRFTGRWGADKDPVRLTNSKIGESAVALYFGLDPLTVLNWIMRSDDGTDLKLPNAIAADVKTTPAHYRKLLWNLECNDEYQKRKFDVLISVSIESLAMPGECWIEGYISKDDFFRNKIISDGSDGLDAGTWNVPKKDLFDIDDLRSTIKLRERING